MNYVIGDIHGEITKLSVLIDNIFKIDAFPSFVFIGDYIDKGENSRLVLDFLLDLNNKCQCVFLRGNHEHYWLSLDKNNVEIEQALFRYGAKNTIESFNTNDIYITQKLLLDRYSLLFNNLKDFYIIDNFVITHSGIPPSQFQKELEDIKQVDFLFNRYDFIGKNELFKNKIVIFGHTGFYYPYYDGFKIGLDTSACYINEQPLTAFCTCNNLFINSSGDQYELSSLSIDSCPVIPRVTPWRMIVN